MRVGGERRGGVTELVWAKLGPSQSQGGLSSQPLWASARSPSTPRIRESLELTKETERLHARSQALTGRNAASSRDHRTDRPSGVSAALLPLPPRAPALTLQHLHSHLQDSIFLAQTKSRGLYHLPKGPLRGSYLAHTHAQPSQVLGCQRASSKGPQLPATHSEPCDREGVGGAETPAHQTAGCSGGTPTSHCRAAGWGSMKV